MSSNFKIPTKCKLCGIRFIAKTTVTKFCSDNCAKRAYKQRKRSEKLQVVLAESVAPEPFKTSKMIKEYYSILEASEMLGASRWTIYRLIEKGELKAAKLGRRTILHKNHIDNLFK